jgi:hypothetical protein
MATPALLTGSIELDKPFELDKPYGSIEANITR